MSGSPGATSPRSGLLVALWLGRRPASFLPTLASVPDVARGGGSPSVVVGAPSGAVVPPEFGADTLRAPSVGQFLALAAQLHDGPVLLVGEPVVLPAADLDATGSLLDDPRVASVSFLSISSIWAQYHGELAPQHWATVGLDHNGMTARLRARATGADVATLLFAKGGAVLLSRTVLDLVGPDLGSCGTASGGFPAFLADLSMRAHRRGLIDLLDATTFVAQPIDLAGPGDGLVSDDDRSELLDRYPFAAEALRLHPEPHPPVMLALQVARMKVMGVRVLLDGSRLGPFETGTQVGVVALARALAARADIESVGITLAGAWPAYARRLGELRKVRTVDPASVPEPRADVFFRPYQPDATFSLAGARTRARRVMINVLDLIAYQIGAYFPNAETWWEYRAITRSSAAAADGVATISHDVADLLRLERVDVEPSRLFPVPFGTDHLTGDEPAEPPIELITAGLADRPFLLCLGTNFAHKNRDVAVRAFAELRRRGHEHLLVLAGPSVPYGSSRVAEARALLHDRDGVVTLPDVPTNARNWLLRHASAVLYPTSAEGFGFVPYEAAVFGTPTAFVPFGPITEIAGGPPAGDDAPHAGVGRAAGWSPEAIADAVESLLGDPRAAEAQVRELLAAGARFTWADTAAALTDAFFAILARSPVATADVP